MTPQLRTWDELAGRKLKRGRGAASIDKLFRERLRARGLAPAQVRSTIMNARASMNGPVPGTQTYQKWLRRQPAAFQINTLGRSRYALFAKGKLTLDKFVDMQTGRSFTLDELRRQEAKAWATAGLGDGE